MKVPLSTIWAQRASYSSCEPSTQWIAAGLRVANSTASRSSVAAGTPVIVSAHAGVLRTPSASPIRYARYDAPAGAPGGRCASSKPST